jgi:uncharacterized protein (TIGR00251 family)
MSKPWCSPLPGGVRLAVQVSPNARRTEVAGVLEDALKIRLQAQPIEGRANEALVRYLAEVLGLPRSAVVLTHGQGSRRKLLELAGPALTPESVMRALLGP